MVKVSQNRVLRLMNPFQLADISINKPPSKPNSNGSIAQNNSLWIYESADMCGIERSMGPVYLDALGTELYIGMKDGEIAHFTLSPTVGSKSSVCSSILCFYLHIDTLRFNHLFNQKLKFLTKNAL